MKYRSQGPAAADRRAAPALRPATASAIEVADNGRGIAEQDRERVFELFRRAGAQDQPGEGIGLAYVRTLVRNLGGDITVTSALDEGTTFRVVLPRNLPVTGECCRMSQDAKPVTIVMIEDDEGHARLIEKNIRRAGVNNEIVPFADGAERARLPARPRRLGRGQRRPPAAGPARPQPAGHDRRRHPRPGSRAMRISSARRSSC